MESVVGLHLLVLGVSLAMSGAALVVLAVADRFDPVRKRCSPPPLDLLLLWTTMFRSERTLSNYLGYVQTGCLLMDAPTQVWLQRKSPCACAYLQVCQVFQEPALKKAKA